jgi:hypothetical protein
VIDRAEAALFVTHSTQEETRVVKTNSDTEGCRDLVARLYRLAAHARRWFRTLTHLRAREILLFGNNNNNNKRIVANRSDARTVPLVAQLLPMPRNAAYIVDVRTFFCFFVSDSIRFDRANR